eukprot:5915332-Pyramimonas_sp.AAC.1
MASRRARLSISAASSTWSHIRKAGSAAQTAFCDSSEPEPVALGALLDSCFWGVAVCCFGSSLLRGDDFIGGSL